MTRARRSIVLTVGELRHHLAELPDHALVAFHAGASGGVLADLQTMFVDPSRGTLVVFSPAQEEDARLFDAVSADDARLVQTLFDEGADIDARDPRSPVHDGATPLTLAAEAGRVAMTTLLLKLGADVDARSASGWTALMRACNAGQLETARILLEAGADPTLVNDEGYTAHGRIPGDDAALLALLTRWEGGGKELPPIRCIVPGELLQSHRPGYGQQSLSRADVDRWLSAARAREVQSILCLLAEDELDRYARVLPAEGGLLGYYRAAGFTVYHVPVADYAKPPLGQDQLDRVAEVFAIAPKPLLVHCAAGIDRSGAAVGHLRRLHGWREERGGVP